MRTWAVGDDFSMADCSACPALCYVNLRAAVRRTHRHASTYLDRLPAAAVICQSGQEAEPYRHMFPK